MIKSITATNHLGDSIKLELGDPEKSGFLIKDIDGLGPPKATVNSTELVSGDGATYNSSRVGVRNIVLGILYQGDSSIEQLRQMTYKYFPIKKKVDLLIETDERVCTISGYVESNQQEIFTEKAGTQISILCPYPYFVSVYTNTSVFSGLDSMFVFPFSNESLLEDLIVMGNVNNGNECAISYNGDVDTGVLITIQALGEAHNIRIFNSNTRETMLIDTARLLELTGSVVIAGDVIEVSTVVGNKYITLTRDGDVINILNCVSRDSDWPCLSHGNNIFAYSAEYGISDLEFQVENNILYEGV